MRTAACIATSSTRITPVLARHLVVERPDAASIFGPGRPIPDTEFARRLQDEYNVTVLPGSFLARESDGRNPGADFVRIALVAEPRGMPGGSRTHIGAFCRSSDPETDHRTRKPQRCMNCRKSSTTPSTTEQPLPHIAPAVVRDAVASVIDGLDAGTLRVAEKRDGEWVVNQWIKKAVLLSFRLRQPVMAGAATQYYDKVPTKFGDYTRTSRPAASAWSRRPSRAGLFIAATWC
jgi:hypothetical protein